MSTEHAEAMAALDVLRSRGLSVLRLPERVVVLDAGNVVAVADCPEDGDVAATVVVLAQALMESGQLDEVVAARRLQVDTREKLRRWWLKLLLSYGLWDRETWH